MTEEEHLLLAILENQRNVAMTELARAAARNAVLERALAEANAKLEKQIV